MVLLYVVGLGGAGSKVVIEFARLIRGVREELEKKGLRFNVKVQVIDMAREPEVEEAIRAGLLSPDDVMVIPPYVIEYNRHVLPVIAEGKKWFPKELIPEISARLRGGQGVERRRPMARLVLHTPDVASMVFQELARDLEELAKAGEGSDMIVAVIVTALGGGFGSGTFIDVAALLRRAFDKAIGGRASLKVFGIFILPHGYATMPPPGIRVEFEEENTMAALRELLLLDELGKAGKPYREVVEGVGEVTYYPLFDAYFVVSYAGVSGANYLVQYKNIDRAIAEFLAFLALIPSEKKAGEAVAKGVALSENILQPYTFIDNMLGRGPSKWKPLAMSFNVVRFEINLEELVNYFRVRREYEEALEKIEKLKAEVKELERKVEEAKVELARAEQEFANCAERVRRALEVARGELPESVVEVVEDFVKRVEDTGVAEVSGFYSRLRAIAPNPLAVYLALVEADRRLAGVERRLNLEKARLVDELKMVRSRREMLIRQYEELPIWKKLMGVGRKIKEEIDSLGKQEQRLESELSVVESKIDAIGHLRVKLVDLISEARNAVDARIVCRDEEVKVENARRRLSDLQQELAAKTADLAMAERGFGRLEIEYERASKSEIVRKLLNILGREGLERVYKLWKAAPEKFSITSFSDLLEIVGRVNREALLDYVRKEFGPLTVPMLDAGDEFTKCMNQFTTELKAERSSLELIKGIKVAIASPKDAEVIKSDKKLGFDAIPLETAGTTIRAIAVFPVIALPCTVEYQKFLAEYTEVKKRLPSFFKQLHVLPVEEMARELEKEGYNIPPYII